MAFTSVRRVQGWVAYHGRWCGRGADGPGALPAEVVRGQLVGMAVLGRVDGEGGRVYSFSSRVRYSEVDESGTLSIYALLNYLQDCSLFQSHELGVGFEHALEVRRRWLLAAWEVEIAHLPYFADEIVVSTWASGFDALYAHRNFTVADAGSGAALVRADSLWFMYDDTLGRPIRPPAEEIEPYRGDLEQDRPLDMPPIHRRIRVEGVGEPAAPLVVTAAHIDTNHHVNNAQYVAMALGVLPEDVGAHVARLDVQYRRAAVLGDVVCPVVHRCEDGPIVQLCPLAASEGDAGGVRGEGVPAAPDLADPYAIVRVYA